MTNTSNKTNTAITQAIKVISCIESLCPTAELKRVDSKKGIIINTNLGTTSEAYFYVLESMNSFIEVEQITISVVLV